MGTEKEKEKERHASWLELFYDLVFAVAIAQLGQILSHDISITWIYRIYCVVCSSMVGMDRGYILCN